MDYIISVIIGGVAMAAIDLPVIAFVIKPTLVKYAPQLVAKKPDGLAALIFYVGYVTLVVYLSQLGLDVEGQASEVARRGALLGLFAYGTYEFTNKAVIKGWPWQMVALDTAWGVVLTSAVAYIAYIV